MVTCGTDGKVHFHQLKSKYRRTDFKGGKNARTAVKCTPTSLIVFYGDASGHIFHTDLSIRSARLAFTPHTSSVNSINFTNDGVRFTTSSNDGSAKLWKSSQCKFLSSLGAHKSWIISSTFSPDGNVVVTSSCDTHVRHWDVPTSICSQLFGPLRAGGTRATFHPDGSIIGSTFSIIDTRDQQIIHMHDRAHSGAITALQVHSADAFALTTSADKKVRI
jgi:centriolar protein POC1